MNALVVLVTRIETKLDTSLQATADHEVRLREIERRPDPSVGLNDHESRLRKVERAIYVAAGAGMLGGAGISEVASKVLGS